MITLFLLTPRKQVCKFFYGHLHEGPLLYIINVPADQMTNDGFTGTPTLVRRFTAFCPIGITFHFQ